MKSEALNKMERIRNITKYLRPALKNTIASIGVLAGIFLFQTGEAQVTVNIVSQPLWGPVNYDYAEYYYLPEADVYYYVPTGEFIYYRGSEWVLVPYLPPTYTIDLFSTYKVVVNEPRPYLHHHVYSKKYAKYKTYHNKQIVIRDSRDEKYYKVKGHPGPAGVKKSKSDKQPANMQKSKGSQPSGGQKGANPSNDPKGKK